MNEEDFHAQRAMNAFLQEYRDLVHRHGLGVVGKKFGKGLTIEAVADPDAHVARVARAARGQSESA